MRNISSLFETISISQIIKGKKILPSFSSFAVFTLLFGGLLNHRTLYSFVSLLYVLFCSLEEVIMPQKASLMCLLGQNSGPGYWTSGDGLHSGPYTKHNRNLWKHGAPRPPRDRFGREEKLKEEPEEEDTVETLGMLNSSPKVSEVFGFPSLPDVSDHPFTPFFLMSDRTEIRSA